MSRYITRSVRSQITNEMYNELEKINGKVVIKMRDLLVVEFNFYGNPSIILFKIVKNNLKIIDPDALSYKGYRKCNFRAKYGKNKDLLQKIENFLRI